MLLLWVTGCILPPPVSLDQGQNQAPFVLPSLSDPNTAEVELNLNCSVCTFKLYASDPDASDTLSTRWFWDYDQGHTESHTDNIKIVPALNGAARAPAVYTTEDLKQLSSELAGSASSSVHTLEVVVSDRDFDSSGTPLNQAPAAGGLTTSLRWTVRFVTRAATCDVRTCQ